MPRRYIDCRESPAGGDCTVAISADSEKELEDAAIQHAVSVHGYDDSPEVRAALRKTFKDSP